MQNTGQPASPTTIEPILPPAMMTWVWERLTVRYGRRFVGIWDGVDLGPVQGDWAYVLRNLTDEQLAWAVDNLPDQPPQDAVQFKRHALSMPDPIDSTPRLPGPSKANRIPPDVLKAMAKLREPGADARPDRVRWAERYIAQWGTAQKLTPIQVEALACARAVMRRWQAGQRHEEDAGNEVQPAASQP